MHWIAPSEKDAASASLETRLWDAADQFRANSGLKAQEHSGLIHGEKAQFAAALRDAVAAATEFCAGHGVDLAAMEALRAGSMARLSAIEDAVEALIAPDAVRRAFFGHQAHVDTLYRAVKPDPSAIESAVRVAGIDTLAAVIRARLRPDPPDISDIMKQIGDVLDVSITGTRVSEGGPPPIDLSSINFKAMAKRFEKSRHRNTDLAALKAAVAARLERMVRLNHTRTDFLEKFEALIESDNNGSRNIEELFEELMTLSNSLDVEQERHVRENLSEEELVIFDILTRPAPELSTAERDEVKKVARDLIARIRSLLVLNWRQKSAARSTMKRAIEDTLDSGLPRAYSPALYREKCSALFEHIYERYPERHAGVYA